MARKVLSWSPRFCIARKSSRKFAEIRYVSLGSLRFVKVRQSSPRFAEILQEPSSFSVGLQGSARLYKVLRRISRTRTCSTRFSRLLEASIGFISVLFLSGSIRFHKDPQGFMGIPWGSMKFHMDPWRSMGFHGIPWHSVKFQKVSQGITRPKKGITSFFKSGKFF